MRTWHRVLAYGVTLVVVLGAAIGIGRLVGPIETDGDGEADHGHDSQRVHVAPVEADDGHDHGPEDAHEGDYELALERDVLESGRPQVAFRVLDEDGEPVTSYDVEHEKELHLIAVRRDLAEFRHVHPRLDRSTGLWTVPIALGAGTWRLYADFVPAGAEPTVTEAELMVAGQFEPQQLGPDTTTSRVDDYEVHLTRDEAAETVTLHVTRDGEEVTDLEPYLGAYGHLVAIRADDLAYLHVHPEDGAAGPEVGFHAEFETDGRYRLFLDFKHGGRVRTADFTVTVGDTDDGPTSEPDDGHQDDGHQDDGHQDEGGSHDH